MCKDKNVINRVIGSSLINYWERKNKCRQQTLLSCFPLPFLLSFPLFTPLITALLLLPLMSSFPLLSWEVIHPLHKWTEQLEEQLDTVKVSWIHEQNDVNSMIHGTTVKRQENGWNDGKTNGKIQSMIRSVIDRWKHGWMMKQRREINVFNIEAKIV